MESTKLPIFNFGHVSTCCYCGDPATDRDHVIPVSYQRPSRKAAFEACGPWTWACRDCNVALSNRWCESFSKRCEWANWRIAKKAEPIEWHGWEMAGLDVSLRSYIRKETAKRKWIQNRADYYQSREFYLNIESLSWEIAKRPPVSAGNQFIFAYFSQTLREIEQLYKPKSNWTRLF